MKISTVVLYLIARLEVSYALFRRHIAGEHELEDLLPSQLIPSVALGSGDDRVLAEIDQDGFAFAVDRRDVEFFETKATITARTSHRIQIVLRDSAVRIRKSAVPKRGPGIRARLHQFMGWGFYVEAAALLRLRGLARVPQIRRIDRAHRTIEMDYVWGRDLRQVLANGRETIEYDDVSRAYSALVARADHDLSRQLTQILESVIARGVVPRDIHPGNLIRGQRSGKLYLVDFNLVYLRAVPGWRPRGRNLTKLPRNVPSRDSAASL